MHLYSSCLLLNDDDRSPCPLCGASTSTPCCCACSVPSHGGRCVAASFMLLVCLGSSLLKGGSTCLPNSLIVPISYGGAPSQGSCSWALSRLAFLQFLPPLAEPAVMLGHSLIVDAPVLRRGDRNARGCSRHLAKPWYCDPSTAPHFCLCLSW